MSENISKEPPPGEAKNSLLPDPKDLRAGGSDDPPRPPKNGDRPSTRHLIWEKTKRPIIFVIVCLLAIAGSLWLFGIKQDYDKKQNAPLVVVDSEVDSPSLKAISGGKLTARLTPGEEA